MLSGGVVTTLLVLITTLKARSERVDMSTRSDVDHHASLARTVNFTASVYHRQASRTAVLGRVAAMYPRLASLYTIGTSVQERPLMVLRLSTDPDGGRQLGKPLFKYVANMHGNEAVGHELLLNLIIHLLANYGISDSITRLMNATEIHIMPTLNPDGFERMQEGDCDGADLASGRTNANDVDLNRNFPDQFRTRPLNGATIVSDREPETLAAMRWIAGRPFVLSANLHGGSVVASYPFDDTLQPSPGRCCVDSPAPDDALFRHLAGEYARRHAYMHRGLDFCSTSERFPGGVTNGAKWYDVPGGMQDFNYVFSNCFEITLELSCCKAPLPDKLAGEWDYNREALLGYMKMVHMGVKGVVSDGSGRPIHGASVSVEGINYNVTTTERGEYWRLLLPGRYRLTASAAKYKASMGHEILVTEGLTAELHFTLQRRSDDAPTFDSLPDLVARALAAGEFVPKLGVYATPPPVPRATTRPVTSTDDPSHVYLADVAAVSGDFTTPPDWKHHDHPALEQWLRDLATSFPSITRLYSIGQSVQNRTLWVLEISDHPGRHEPGEPEFKYVANMHGDETVGRELLLLLARHLCETYPADNQTRHIVDNVRVHLMPTMNPDGYAGASPDGNFSQPAARANANGVDLNRNFPDRWGTVETNGVQEPETAAVMRWSGRLPFVLSANLHGGSVVANYPWDSDEHGTRRRYVAAPDDAVFRQLANSYSLSHETMHAGRGCRTIDSGFPGGITNGNRWYSLRGGMQDWNYVATNCLELTLELSCDKFPPARRLPVFWRQNRNALKFYIERALTGVSGFVVDARNNPIANVTVSVENIVKDVTTAADGDYWRLLEPGKHRLFFHAPGYTLVRRDVDVPYLWSHQLNVTLLADDGLRWSAEQDLSIEDNLHAAPYSSRQQLTQLMAALENRYPVTHELLVNVNDWNTAMPTLKVTAPGDVADSERTRVVLLAGARGGEPAGGELLLRLARHLGDALNTTSSTSSVTELLRSFRHMILYIVPRVDAAAYDPQNEGNCSRSSDVNSWPSHLDSMMRSVRPQFALSLESDGVFVRYPPNAQSNWTASTDQRRLTETLAWVYVTHHPRMQQRQSPCDDQLALGMMQGWDVSNRRFNNMHEHFHQSYGTLMISAHISCCAFPRHYLVPSLWRENLAPLLAYLQTTVQGVSGRVVNARGEPLANAEVEVVGDGDVNVTVNTSHSGFYHHFLPVGQYSINVSHAGYARRSDALAVRSGAVSSASVVMEDAQHLPALQYHHGNESTQLLYQLARHHTEVTKFHSLADRSGVNISCLEISLDIHKSSSDVIQKPAVLFMAALSSVELVTSELLLQLATHLATRYKTDSQVSRLLSAYRVLIIPVLSWQHRNITQLSCRPTTDDSSDLLHAFPLDSTPESGGLTGEAGVVVSWLARLRPQRTLLLRTGAPTLVTIPYSYRQPGLPAIPQPYHTTEDQTLMAMGDWYMGSVDTSVVVSDEGCADSQPTHTPPAAYVLHQGSLHPIHNYLADYMYLHNLSMPLSVYVACCSAPSADELSAVWRRHRQSLLRFIDLTQGVQGFVTDEDGSPIQGARLTVNSSSFASVTADDGQFWRPAVPGNAVLHICAAGYLDKTGSVSVSQGVVSRVQMKMARDSTVAGMSRTVYVFLLGGLGILCVVVCMLCVNAFRWRCPPCSPRRDAKKRKHYGFHLLKEKFHSLPLAGEHSDEDTLVGFHDISLTKTTRKPGDGDLFGTYASPYRDVPSSDSSSEDELFSPVSSSHSLLRSSAE